MSGGACSRGPGGASRDRPGEATVRRQADPVGQDKSDSERPGRPRDLGPGKMGMDSRRTQGPQGTPGPLCTAGPWGRAGSGSLVLGGQADSCVVPFQNAGRRRRSWRFLTAGRQSHSRGPLHQLKWEQSRWSGPCLSPRRLWQSQSKPPGKGRHRNRDRL